MLASLEDSVRRHAEITERLTMPGLTPKELGDLNKERARLEPIVTAYNDHTALTAQLGQARAMLVDADEDMRGLARDEVAELEPKIHALEEQLKVLLLPRDPNDDRDVILEIRAGTGGDEAAIFAGDLFAMYAK